MLKPILTTAPGELPVSAAEMRAQSRIGHADDDALVSRLIEAATSHLDGFGGILGRALVTQSWAVKLHDFADVMRLPVGDLIGVTSVKYFDTLGVEQTASSSLYGAYTDAQGPFIELKHNQVWPSVSDRRDAISIEWTCGYGAAAAVPQSIRHGIMMLAAHWYENREATGVGGFEELPLTVKSLISPYRQVGI